MQAVITLCYFCENHGPRVVLVCQPMRNELREGLECFSSEADAMDTDEEPPRFYGDIGSREDVLDDEPRCAACSSFGSGVGILSNDHEAETSYVSTQTAIHERVHYMVKQACLRSLSVEISTPLYVDTELPSCSSFSNEPAVSHKIGVAANSSSHDFYSNNKDKDFFDRDGVVLFGDDTDGYVLSHTFKLKDAKARGFHRSYSLIIVSRDKLMLLTNYEFFLGGFSAIISKMQSMAEQFCIEEQRSYVDLRIAAQSSRASYLPQQFYPRNVTLDTLRSLTEITNNKNIFVLLHRQMLYLLKTQTMLEQDTVLEGCPTQDMLVMMEMECNSMEVNDLLVSLSTEQSCFHFHNLRIIVQKLYAISSDFLTALIWQIVVGGQVVVKSDFFTARRLFLLALLNLLPLGCIKIAFDSADYIYAYKYNFLGCPLNVSVPEDVREEVFEVEICPKKFLSKNASSNYTSSSSYNNNIVREEFIDDSISPCSSSSLATDNSSGCGGLPSATMSCDEYTNNSGNNVKMFNKTISSVKSDLFADKISNIQRHNRSEGIETRRYNNDDNDAASTASNDDLSQFDFVVVRAPSRSGAKPLILSRYLELLLHPMLNVCTLESSIRATRDEWLNRAKLIFQLRHQKEGIDISKTIKIIKCGSEDSPVLLFWQSGLSRRYKQVVLNTINNSASTNDNKNETPRRFCEPVLPVRTTSAPLSASTLRGKNSNRINTSTVNSRSGQSATNACTGEIP